MRQVRVALAELNWAGQIASTRINAIGTLPHFFIQIWSEHGRTRLTQAPIMASAHKADVPCQLNLDRLLGTL